MEHHKIALETLSDCFPKTLALEVISLYFNRLPKVNLFSLTFTLIENTEIGLITIMAILIGHTIASRL